MQKEMILALYQMKVSNDEDENWEKVCQAVQEAKQRRASLLMLPELWSNGDALGRAVKTAVPLGEGIFAKLSALAQSLELCLLGSNFALFEEGKVGNTAVFYRSDGGVGGVYTKIHLFRLMDEHRYFTAGTHLTMTETAWGKVGIAICYDLRFPEVFREYALKGAKLICLPAAWPHPRLAHWHTLLRARAIENQLFVAACNRVGKNGPLEFFGNSCVIDPWGETLVLGGEEEALLTATLNFESIEQARAKIPVFEDRAEGAYHLHDVQ